MTEIKIEYNGVTYSGSLPECWEDLSLKGYRAVQRGGDWRLLLSRLCGIPKKVFRAMLDFEVEAVLTPLCSSDPSVSPPGDEKPPTPFFYEVPFHGRNFVPWLGVLKGRKSKFVNLTCGELAMSDLYFQAYNSFLADDQEADPKVQRKMLLGMLSSVYRLPGVPHREWMIPVWVFLLKLVPNRKLLCAYNNYWGMRQWMSGQYPRSYSGGGGGDDHGWRGMFLDLAGEKFGTIEKIGRIKAHDVMTHIEKSLERQRKK